MPQVPMSRPPVTAPGIVPPPAPQAVLSTPFAQIAQAGVQPIASGVQRSGTPIPASAWPPPSQPPPAAPRTLTPGSQPPMPRAPGSQPPMPRAMSQPPTPRAPGSQPPGSHALPPPAAAIADEPDTSLPTMARRPWGWIVVVLLLDIGLAVSGSWMLYAGLGDRGDTHDKAP